MAEANVIHARRHPLPGVSATSALQKLLQREAPEAGWNQTTRIGEARCFGDRTLWNARP